MRIAALDRSDLGDEPGWGKRAAVIEYSIGRDLVALYRAIDGGFVQADPAQREVGSFGGVGARGLKRCVPTGRRIDVDEDVRTAPRRGMKLGSEVRISLVCG